MTNNLRVFLWLGLGLALWVNYSQWQMDYGPQSQAAIAAQSAAQGTNTPLVEDTVPQADQAAPATTADDVPSVAPAPDAAPTAPEAAPASLVRVITDVLVLDIDLKGGTLVYAELPGYPIVKGQPNPVVLFNHGNPATNYSLQTGLAGPAAGSSRPTHLAEFTSPATRYELTASQNELRVPLTWTDAGITVTKTFVFRRSSYGIDLEYAIYNQGTELWPVHSYARIVRTDPPVERSMFKVESFAFRGPAVWAPSKAGESNHYRKLKIDETEDHIKLPVTDGWLAALQHHFVSAIVPDKSRTYEYSLALARDQTYILGAFGAVQNVAPGSNAIVKEQLFVGPKLQRQLDTLHPELSRVADYGLLTPLSKPLFWLLDNIHTLVKNWGVAIILATLLLKLAFYPLAQYSGKSMARMRKVTPRIKVLQETYKDDREKLGRAMMELYKNEKVNPLSGCLPMLIQMPVFLAFYWVLLESVEMRQAPFFGWINDLSSRDPYFILPALNGLAMWVQYKLNPPPPDPVQAKVFQFMPLVFSVMFALFPAGLVLYWVTNTGLSILQQWNINRHIEAADKAQRK